MIVECEALSQRYGRHQVLSGLTLSIGAGITVLLGPNGAGKTTLLETIATLRSPAAGKLKVLGLDVDSSDITEVRRRTGFLPQSMGYFGRFTVLEFVEYTTWLKGITSRNSTVMAKAAIDRVGLSDVLQQRMDALSGGMLRRVGIAQAISHGPDLIILDEPSGGLDPGQRIGLRNLARELSADASFVISTHLVDDLRSLADDVIVLFEGKVAFQGSTGKLEAGAAENAVGDSALERGYSSVLGMK